MKKFLGTIAAIGMVSALAVAVPLSACTPAVDPDAIDYSVLVRSAGGIKLEGVTVTATDASGNVAGTAVTDKNGNATLHMLPAAYTLSVSNVPVGYTVTSQNVTTDLTGETVSTFVCTSAVIKDTKPAGTVYAVGDVMYDFTVSTPYNGSNGEPITYTLSELLEEKKMVILNLWSTRCTWCVREFPSMQASYVNYTDKAEIIAANAFYSGSADSAETIASFRTQNSYTFPMVQDNGVVSGSFTTEGFPFTVVVDRYGVVAQTHTGAILDEEDWNEIFEKYTADDYAQDINPGENPDEPDEPTLVHPDVDMPSSDAIKAAISPDYDFTYRALADGENGAEYCWPFILSKDGKSIVPGNGGREMHNSYSILYVDVPLKKGDVLLFDYKSDTETTIGGSDIFYVFWNGTPVGEIYGNDQGKFYAFVAEETDTYELAFSFVKDSDDSSLADGQDDTVYISNLRIGSIGDIAQNGDYANILRHAADGEITENTTGAQVYERYATAVLNEEDHYYHVGSADGPLLFANLLTSTHWSNYGIYQYLSSDMLPEIKDQLMNYVSLSAGSAIYGYCPVDETLHSLLRRATSSIASQEGRTSHAREWLELCVYYDHYGIDEGYIENPVNGLSPYSPIEIEENQPYFSDIDRALPTRGYVYSFTPAEDGIYHFYAYGGRIYGEGMENAPVDTVIWLYGSLDDYLNENVLGTNDDNADGVHYSLNMYLHAGQTYYFNADFSMKGDLGNFYVTVERFADSGYVWHSMAGDNGGFYYTMEITGYDPITGSEQFGRMILLTHRVVLGDDGIYHAVNSDGSIGSPVYMNLTNNWYMTTASTPSASVASMVESGVFASLNKPVYDENGNIVEVQATAEIKLDGKTVTCPLYYDRSMNTVYEYEGQYYYRMDGTNIEDNGYDKSDLTVMYASSYEKDPTDYTDIMRKYVEAAQKTPHGYVAVTKELADIIEKFMISNDIDFAPNGEISEANPNGTTGMINGDKAWLLLACYYYDYQGPEENPEYPMVGEDDDAIGGDIWYGYIGSKNNGD